MASGRFRFVESAVRALVDGHRRIAGARREVLGAFVAAEQVRDAAQQAIAGVVAVGIVDALEEIDAVSEREAGG